MSFAWPAALGFLGLLPAIAILYFLKLRRTPKVVSSTYLWKKAVDSFRVNRPFDRFRNQLLLWVQLLILGLLVVALAKPFLRAEQEQSDVQIYLVDHSASMGTREGDRTRLDLAKDFVRAAIRNKRDGDRMMIIAFSDRSNIVAPMTTEKDALLAALDSIEPTGRPTVLGEAWQTALSVARQFDHSDILVVSDGGFGPLHALTEAHATVRYVPVGSTLDNVGITRLESRETDVREIFAQVYNRRAGSSTVRVELLLNDRLVDARDVAVPPGEKIGVVFRRPFADEGVAEVRLQVQDAFPADDRAWVPLQNPEPAKVVLVGEENLFLREVLRNDPNVELTLMAPKDFVGDVPCDLLVLDGVVPARLPKGAVLSLSPSGGEPATVARWEDHSLTRHVNFATLHIEKLTQATLPNWMRPLLITDRGPAIAAGESGDTRMVSVFFSLLDSDWPLRLSFPLFIGNVVRWAKTPEGVATQAVRPGAPLALAVPAGVEHGTVKLPDGRERTVGRRAVVADTDRQGVYRVRWDGATRDDLYVVSLLDPSESDLSVRPEVRMGEERVAGLSQRALVRRDRTKWFLLAAVVLLFAEWFLYQFRRN